MISSLTIMKQRDRNVHRPQPSLPLSTSDRTVIALTPWLHCNKLIPQRNDFDQNQSLKLKSSSELGGLLRIIELQSSTYNQLVIGPPPQYLTTSSWDLFTWASPVSVTWRNKTHKQLSLTGLYQSNWMQTIYSRYEGEIKGKDQRTLDILKNHCKRQRQRRV